MDIRAGSDVTVDSRHDMTPSAPTAAVLCLSLAVGCSASACATAPTAQLYFGCQSSTSTFILALCMTWQQNTCFTWARHSAAAVGATEAAAAARRRQHGPHRDTGIGLIR